MNDLYVSAESVTFTSFSVAKSRDMSDKVVSLGGVSMLERVKWSRVVNNLYSVNRFEDVL